MGTVDPFDVNEAAHRLTAQNPQAAMEVAKTLTELEQRAKTEIEVFIGDKYYGDWQVCGDYIELGVEWPRNKVQIGHLTLKGNDQSVPRVLSCDATTVPVIVQAGKLRWSGRVDKAHDKFGATEPDTVECELLGDYAWLTRVIAWPNFLTPIFLQFPSRGTAMGGAVSVLKFIIAIQTFRIQSGLWDMVNNLGSLNFDWRTWMSGFFMRTLGQGRLPNMNDIMRALRTPVYVVPTNPFFDTSPFIAVTWKMQKLSELIEQIVEDNGLSVEVCAWLPGDPQPPGIIFPLTSPTIVVDIKDKQGVIGPTGTFLDGILRTGVDLSSTVFGGILTPLLNPTGLSAPLGINIAPAIGLNWVQPWVLFNGDDPRTGVRGELVHHHPMAWRIIAGGRSPKWLNDFFNATIGWLLDLLMIFLGIVGIPTDMLSGIFDNAFFAFQLCDLYDRRIGLGPYGFPESFTPTQHGTYQLNMLFVIHRAIWDTRGYISGQLEFDQGFPYEAGRDIFPGALATVVRRGYAYTDYIENIKLLDTREVRCKITVQIGDGKDEAPPAAKLQRRLIGFQEFANTLMLSIQN